LVGVGGDNGFDGSGVDDDDDGGDDDGAGSELIGFDGLEGLVEMMGWWRLVVK